MSDTSKGLVSSAEPSKVGPDYFAYYTHAVKDLLAQDEDFLPFAPESVGNKCEEVRSKSVVEHGSGPFFSNSLAAGLSDFKKERLNALLRQALSTLTPEVDEMLDPVKSMCWLQSHVRTKNGFSDSTGEASKADAGQVPDKKLEMSSSSSSTSIPTLASAVNSGSCREGTASKCIDSKYLDVDLPGKGVSNGVQNHCAHCSTTNIPEWTGLEGKVLCNACEVSSKNRSESHFGPNPCIEKGNGEVDDDLQFLLQNDSSLVEEIMKKYSDELFTSLDHMEQQLEELLDTVVSTCRPMTLTEKQQLQKLVQKLPPKYLDRVAEIVLRRKPGQDRNEIFVDLMQQDNVTLWRLCYHAEAVEKAGNISS